MAQMMSSINQAKLEHYKSYNQIENLKKQSKFGLIFFCFHRISLSSIVNLPRANVNSLLSGRSSLDEKTDCKHTKHANSDNLQHFGVKFATS